MKRSLYAVLAFAVMSVAACGGNANNGTADGGPKKIKASQLLFVNKQGALVALTTGQGTEGCVDTETKFLASNVEFETGGNSALESENVQQALEQLSLDLGMILPGEWTIQNNNQEAAHHPDGHVIINVDGTFNLLSGSFAAIGMGTISDGFDTCGHTDENQTYQALSDRVYLFKHVNDTVTNSAIPVLVSIKQDEIVFMGQGGCGESGRQRVSILKRVIPAPQPAPQT